MYDELDSELQHSEEGFCRLTEAYREHPIDELTLAELVEAIELGE